MFQVTSSVLQTGCFAYCRACIATLLRREGGHTALYYGGSALQLGAFTGGVTGFLLVNVFAVFESAPTCSGM